MLEVQTYLLTHSFADLAREHGVYARVGVGGHKVSMNYDQIEAKDGNPIVEECRGLVLGHKSGKPVDMAGIVGALDIFALPMRRFYNFGQGHAASVDLNNPNTRFFEKLDGTLCVLYYDRILRDWCVATRSVADADLPMDGFGNQTFASLFWKAFKASGGDISTLDYAKGQHTFCFELCCPDNQVVVYYPDYKVYLLAARENSTGDEMSPEGWARQIGVGVCPSYRFGSTAEMLEFVSSRDPSKHEGIVVCDTGYNRVKVKNANYMALSKIKDSVVKSPRAVLEIILHGKEDDVMPLVPAHIQEEIHKTKDKLARLIVSVDEEYVRLYHPDRKTFALGIQANSGWMAPHMARWTGKAQGCKDWILSNKKNGTWADGFLDSILSGCAKVGNP